LTYNIELDLGLLPIFERLCELSIIPALVLAHLFGLPKELGVVSLLRGYWSILLLLEVIKVLGHSKDLLLVELYGLS
jgi:hypothetical protein